jgi:hypothetical protein
LLLPVSYSIFITTLFNWRLFSLLSFHILDVIWVNGIFDSSTSATNDWKLIEFKRWPCFHIISLITATLFARWSAAYIFIGANGPFSTILQSAWLIASGCFWTEIDFRWFWHFEVLSLHPLTSLMILLLIIGGVLDLWLILPSIALILLLRAFRLCFFYSLIISIKSTLSFHRAWFMTESILTLIIE